MDKRQFRAIVTAVTALPNYTERKITEVYAMARSTNEECARLSALNDVEAFVLFHVAYGYDFEFIDRDLSERPDGIGRTVLGTLESICEKLQINGITRECDRIRKAGKILIDAKEIERERSYAEKRGANDKAEAVFA